MLQCNTEEKQEVSDFSLSYYGSTLKKMRETWERTMEAKNLKLHMCI